jgi:hypothetical protein
MDITERKVYDTFLFNNELDLLEIRLNVLNEHVDYFVIVEAEETFTNIKKPLYFKENKDRFSQFGEKIIHYVVDNTNENLWNFSKSSPNVGKGEFWWVREFYQKENILVALDKTKIKDDDIVFVSDLDEIWNPKTIYSRGEYDYPQVYRPIQTAYHYFLNNKSNQDISAWVGTRFGTYGILKKFGANHFRTEREVKSTPLKNGGWHFTNIGNKDFIFNKIQSYSHQEYNHPHLKQQIDWGIDNNIDFLNRGFSLWKDESDLPEYVLLNRNKYEKIML